MKRNIIVATALAGLCLGAYFSGRSYQRSQASVADPTGPPTAVSVVNPSANFGDFVYNNIAKISFADVYQALRIAPTRLRADWLHQIEKAPESPHKIAALCGYLRALAQVDPLQAGDLVVELKRHRSPAMEAVISAALPSAMPQLVKMLLKLPPAVRTYGLTDHLAIALEDWAQIDPRAVADFLDAHNQLPIQEYDIALLKNWAGIDARAAWNWLEAHSQNISPFARAYWLGGWFGADPEGAIDYGLSHVHAANMSDAITSLAPELFQQNELKARDFIRRLPTIELRQDALSRIADLWSPLSLNEWSPRNAAAFIVQFAPGEWPKNFSNVMGRWRDLAASDLVAWIAQLPSQLQINVIDRFPAPSSFEPEQDFLPLLQLSDSDVRSKLLQQMVQRLGSEVQSSPKEALASLKLSPEKKTELAAFLPRDDTR
jgi:hypothetical protein